MNNLDLKYIFAGCIVLFIILYFSYPEIIKSLKERFSHNTETSCTNACTDNSNEYGTSGTYADCYDVCRAQQ